MDKGQGVGDINITSGDLTAVSSGGIAPGARAAGKIVFAGADNDIALTAIESGVAGNNLGIELVSVAAGQEAVIYDPILHTLTLLIANGVTRASDLITLINVPAIPFTASSTAPETGSGGFVHAPKDQYSKVTSWLLYPSDAADHLPCVDLGGRRSI